MQKSTVCFKSRTGVCKTEAKISGGQQQQHRLFVSAARNFLGGRAFLNCPGKMGKPPRVIAHLALLLLFCVSASIADPADIKTRLQDLGVNQHVDIPPEGTKNPDVKLFDEPANISGKPVIVTVHLQILDINQIDDDSQDFSVTMYLRQQWKDPRLAFKDPKTSSLVLTDPSKIWVPDLMFLNEKEGRIHDITSNNAFIRIQKDGEVLYSTRLTVALSCPMDHSEFPMDEQICKISMESYAHRKDELVFIWNDDLEPVVINEKLTLDPFELQAYGYDYCTSNTTSGEFSCIVVELSFGRSALEQYLVLAYLPVAAMVIVAYLTLWVPERRGPRLICALSAFGVTALTAAVITTLDPDTNDSTALDCWAKWSVLFAFIPILAILVTGCGQMDIDDDAAKVVGTLNFPANSLFESAFVVFLPILFIIFNLVYWFYYYSNEGLDGLGAEKKFEF
ncbi:glutamate-gated chloride channel-like [Cloeon dipterum]|uniref:glutamate-gated chloride channel-like n=1 Tax=Cloeon dipterum TaxID=197152 RepID=UPI0032206EB7